MSLADIAEWNLAASLGVKRLGELDAPLPFESIVASILAEMHVMCMHPDPSDIAQGFERFIYCLKVSRTQFDLFFNSKSGYRAAYFVSPYEGRRANEEALATLTPWLVASKVTGEQRSRQFIEQSLLSPSAKIWLAEPQRGFCSDCSGEWSNPRDNVPEILNGRWENAANENALKGRKAPYFSKLRVFGAFLNAQFDELIPERKRHRAQHIHQWGWA